GAAARPERQPGSLALRGRPAAGAGGADSGAVRAARHAADRRRARARPATLAGPELPPATDHRRPRQLLGEHVPPGTQGPPGPLFQTRLAGRPLVRDPRTPAALAA